MPKAQRHLPGIPTRSIYPLPRRAVLPHDPTARVPSESSLHSRRWIKVLIYPSHSLYSMSDEKEQARQVLDESYSALDEDTRTFLKARIGIEDEAQLKKHILEVQLSAWTVSPLACKSQHEVAQTNSQCIRSTSTDALRTSASYSMHSPTNDSECNSDGCSRSQG